jgi:hypothetical protein
VATQRVLSPFAIGASSGTLISSPFQFAVSGEDNLRIRVWFLRYDGGVIPGFVIVSWRSVDAQGNITISQQAITPANNTAIKGETFIALGAGFIQNLTVTCAPFGTLNGLCYVTVDLIRGLTAGNATLAGQLIGGYIRPGSGQAWPGSPVLSSTQGRGMTHVIDLGPGTIGADYVVEQPLLVRWRPSAVFARLVTSVAAGTRFPQLGIQVAPPAFGAVLPSPAGIGPGTFFVCTWLAGVSQLPPVAGQPLVGPLPTDMVTMGGTTYSTVTNGLDVNDQYTDFRLTVEEWLEANV